MSVGSGLTRVIDHPSDDTAFGGIFYSPFIDSDLPHHIYQQKQDSVAQIKAKIDYILKGAGERWSFGAIGISAIEPPDWLTSSDYKSDREYQRLFNKLDSIGGNANRMKDPDSLKLNDQARQALMDSLEQRSSDMRTSLEKETDHRVSYYLALTGYSLEPENRFFIQNGTYNLAIVKWGEIKVTRGDSVQKGVYVRKPISVRYASEAKQVLIPVSKKTYRILKPLLVVLVFGQVFLFIYIVIGLPVQILINISRGDAFNPKNVSRLRLMSLVLFLYGLLDLFGPNLLRLAFSSRIPGEFELSPFHTELWNNLHFFLAALAIFIVSKAFARGCRLKQEQELTI
ncbi:MAG TPA: DUF2975 domain-containing protein [Flavisolibacter sp.]|nr:DUF2975 domain-containing protein [Flavisolibacter sp.]